MLRTVHKTLSAGANYLTYQIGNQELFLLGANLEVADSAGNSTRNAAGNIWLQQINEANALSLAVGNLRNGCIQGYGCLPLERGYEIQSAIYHATSGEIGKLNLMVMTAEIAKKLGIPLNPHWSQRQDSIPIMHNGRIKCVQVVGTASATTANLRPGDGYIWEIMECWMAHNDGTSRTLNWHIIDTIESLDIPKESYASVASGDSIPYCVDGDDIKINMLLSPLTISYDCYLQAKLDAISAGKQITIQALVREYSE